MMYCLFIYVPDASEVYIVRWVEFAKPIDVNIRRQAFVVAQFIAPLSVESRIFPFFL